MKGMMGNEKGVLIPIAEFITKLGLPKGGVIPRITQSGDTLGINIIERGQIPLRENKLLFCQPFAHEKEHALIIPRNEFKKKLGLWFDEIKVEFMVKDEKSMKREFWSETLVYQMLASPENVFIWIHQDNWPEPQYFVGEK